MNRKTRALGPLLAILVACAGAGCRRAAQPAPANVVLITIDTLRASRCSLYGHERKTTPFLDELATRSTVFDNAHATSSWTAPSMASLFTSLPPRSHGVIHGFVEKGKVIDQEVLSGDFVTLAEALAGHGYKAFGVSTNGHLTAKTGFGQGFDVLTEIAWEPASAVEEKTLLLRDRLRAAESYFLWVHYLDPHWPYEERQPWFDSYQATLRQDVDGAEIPPGKGKNIQAFFEMLNRYDSEIAYVDDSIRRLFSELALEQNSLVIVTADHGEAFFDHGQFSHGQSLYEEEIRVPLLVRLPGQVVARRVDSVVSLVDLYPTILDIVGIDSPTNIEGLSLLPAVRGDGKVERAVVAELDRDKPKHRSLIRQGWKLYRKSAPDAFVRLFDLQEDPHERNDRAAAEADRLDAMQRRWAEWEKDWPRFDAPRRIAPLDAGARERLRALGYLK